MADITTTSTMIEPRHSFVVAKAEAPTRDGRMTDLAETASGEAIRVALEVQDHGLGLKTRMEM